MSDVLIKGIEMPKRCRDCRYCYDIRYCLITGTHVEYSVDDFKAGTCPLVEVPTHGDLVDRKDVLDAMNEEIVPKGVFLSDIYKALDIVPIVIEASTEERE